MSNTCCSCSKIPSLVKKYLMGLSGLVLVLFVMGHMLGNLQFFLGPDAINAYAYKLHNMPGHPFSLWAIRLFLAACLIVHVWMAVLLTKENRAARPEGYDNKSHEASTYSARTMPITGLIILSFAIFHILHYTTRIVPENYNETIGLAPIETSHVVVETFDVFAMMVAGFSSPLVSLFYMIAVGLLCMHLAHGVSSMFQSFGFRNEIWRPRLAMVAKAYGFIVFLGFASIPAGVLGGFGKEYLEEKREAWAQEGQLNPSAEIASANFSNTSANQE